MTIKAIIFDMDGTIIDTEHIWERATKELIEGTGTAYTEELHNTLRPAIHGVAMNNSIKLIKELAELPHSIEELVERKNKIADTLFLEGVRFIEGFPEFHASTRLKELKTAIATNAGDNTLKLVHQALDLKKFFGEHTYGISSVNYVAKPHPAIYLHAAEQLGVHPHECIAIEDSARGIEAAIAAGMFCIGINTSGKREQIKDSHHIVDSYREIDLESLVTQKHPF